MRAILAASVVLAAGSLLSPTASHAQIYYPWCVQYTGHGGGGRNCGFVSYEQCMETARGAGGFCERNLFYTEPTPPVRRHKKPAQRD